MARAVLSMSTTIPFLRPVEGAIPTPRTSTRSPSASSPTMVQTFVVPMSRPTMISLLVTNEPSLQKLPADHREVQEDAPAQGDNGSQVEVLHADLIAEERQGDREDHVHDEPGQKDVVLELPVQPGPDAAEDRIHSGQGRQRKIAGELVRDFVRQSEHHAETDREGEQRQKDLTELH